MSAPHRVEAAWNRAQALLEVRDRAELVTMAQDADWDRREAGIWGLGQMGDPQDLPLLGALLGDDHVNDAAEESLKDFGAAAEPALLAALDRPDGVGVLHALDALRAVGGPGAVARIVRCLDDEDLNVRSWAIEALSDIGERGAPAAWEALRAHAEDESDPDLRDLLVVVLPVPGTTPGPER